MSWLHPAETSETTESGMKVENLRADVPEFRREYSGRLDERAKCVIEARTSTFGRYFTGELEQPNGNKIWFDPARIADKIIDPLLVPLVSKFCDEMFALDRAYVKSKPSEFVDKNGDRWKRS